MPDQPCPGACNTGWRNTGEGEPRPGEPVWCRTDTTRIRRQLTELDDLAALVDYLITGQKIPATSPAGAAESPSPSPSGDDLFDLKEMLLGWEDAYRHEHNRRYPEQPWLSRPHRGTIASVTTTTIAWLTSHLDGVLAADCAADAGLEVGQWHRYLWSRTRAGTGRRRGVIPCPRCEYMLLASAAGTDYWVCGHCGRHLAEDEYQELCDVHRRLEHAS